MKKPVVRSIDVIKSGDMMQIHFFLYGQPKKVYLIQPARWLKLLESAKQESVDIQQVVDSIYHKTVLHFAENTKEFVQ